MKKKVYDVVIVGAGISGLSAALEAKKQKLTYVVLDARDRAGGRIFSKKLKGGLVVELGAEWIGKTHKDLLGFCRSYKVPLELHQYTDLRYYTKDNVLVPKFPSLIKRLEEVVLRQREVSIPHATNTYELLEKYFSTEELRILSRVYGPDFATHWRYVSARDAFQELRTGGESDHMDYHVKGGNTKLVEVLVREVGRKNIHLSEEVQQISDTDCVSVQTNKSTYLAKKVLVTAGLKQLKHIKVTPPLREKRQQAKQLSYGDITKAFVSFKGPLPLKKQKLASFSETDIPYVYVATQGQSKDRFGLCVYAVGPAAKKIAKMKPDTFIKKVLAVLPRDVFPVDHLVVEDLYIQHWGAEKFSEGAYCIYNPGEHKEILSSFGVPHGNIHFAGDYLGDFFNYMNGAFQSGRDSMRTIVTALK